MGPDDVRRQRRDDLVQGKAGKGLGLRAVTAGEPKRSSRTRAMERHVEGVVKGPGKVHRGQEGLRDLKHLGHDPREGQVDRDLALPPYR